MVEASDRPVECNKDLMDFFFKAIWFPRDRVSSPPTITMLNGILRAVTKGFSSSLWSIPTRSNDMTHAQPDLAA